MAAGSDPVGEVNHLRWHAQPLERREHLDALADRHAEIVVVVDNQHRRLEVLRQQMRRMLAVRFRLLDPLRLLLGQRQEFLDAGRAAELVGLAADDPGAGGIGLGPRHRANLVARLGLHIVGRLEAAKLLGAGHAAVGLDVGLGVETAGREKELALLGIVDPFGCGGFLMGVVHRLEADPEALAADGDGRDRDLDALAP